MKTYEMCFLGRFDSNSYRYEVCRVTDESGSEVDKAKKTLFFSKKMLTNLSIGDYMTATTDDDNIFKQFKRLFNPVHKVSDDLIISIQMKEAAEKTEIDSIKNFRGNQKNLDGVLDALKEAELGMSRRERSLFALYVYQKLL